jgi:hypothetical protein
METSIWTALLPFENKYGVFLIPAGTACAKPSQVIGTVTSYVLK